jgi:tetratricopeptide (TPR) repeat protein
VTAALLAIALALSPLSPRLAGGEGRGEEGVGQTAQLRRAVHLLQTEDVPGARAIVEPLLASDPNSLARAVGGMLRFREQRYAEAVQLFESIGTDASGLDDADLARNARAVTKDHVRVEGEHFAVSYPRGKDEVLVPYVLDALEAQRRALVGDLGWVPPEKVTIEFLDTPRQLAKMSTLTEEEIKTSGTIALCKYGKLMVVSPKALVKGYEWLDTAAHEYVHFVLSRRAGEGIPIWLHEGIAKWGETRWRGKGGASLSPYSGALLKDAAKRNALIPFAKMHPSMAKLPSQEAAALAFAQVMVAVEYLAESAGPRAIARVVELVREGKGAEEAVAAAAGTTFEGFLAGWKKHISARPLPLGGERDLERLRFKGDPKHGGAHSELAEIKDEQARGWARLGEIFRERGRLVAARVQYEKAISRAGGTNPALAAKYAVTAIATGKDADAERALREAARRHPFYAALHVNLGRIHVRRQEWPQARDSFLLANRTDPFDPEIHAGLALAHEGLAEPELAAREKKLAQLLAHGER